MTRPGDYGRTFLGYWKGESVFKSMLLTIVLMFAGHVNAMGESPRVKGETWLLGLGSQVDAAIEVARLGSQNPGSVSDNQVERAIVELASVIDRIEIQLDRCTSTMSDKKNCKLESNSKKSIENYRRKILNQKAMVVFFRNLLVLEYNKPKTQRNYSLSFRVGDKIKRFA